MGWLGGIFADTSGKLRAGALAALMAATVPAAAAVEPGTVCGDGVTVKVPGTVAWPGQTPDTLEREEPEVLHAMELPTYRSELVRLDFAGLDLGAEGALLISDGKREEFLVYLPEDIAAGGTLGTAFLPGGERLHLEVISPAPTGGESFRIHAIEYVFSDPASPEAVAAKVEAGFGARRIDDDLPGHTEWEGPDPKVIYGRDSRQEVHTIENPMLRAMADSVALVTARTGLTDVGNGQWELNTVSWTSVSGYPVCSNERFRGQPRPAAGGDCTGFLAGPDIFVTAGHCIDDQSCAGRAFVFGFRMEEDGSGARTIFDHDEVYYCSEVLARQLSNGRDWAVVRLDREVTGADPLPIRASGRVSHGTPLAMIGHPVALPMKMASDASVQSPTLSTLPFFSANLDAYGGNSGSPVFNTESYAVEGILVRGLTDFRVRPGENCAESNVMPHSIETGGTQFEDVARSTDFASYIPGDPVPTPTPGPTPTPTVPPVPRTEIIDTILGYIALPGDTRFAGGDRNEDGVWDAADVFLRAP